MNYFNKALLLGLTAFLLLLSGCKDLSVENTNEPDRERALSSPEDLETLIKGTYRTFYYAGEGYEPNFALSVSADEISSSWGNFGMQDMGSEPRQPYNNDPSYSYSAVAEVPFSNAYSAISAAVEGLNAVEESGLSTPEATERAKAFAQFVIGAGHAHVAAVHDQGFTVEEVPPTEAFDPKNPPFEIKDSEAVFDVGLKYLDQAIQTAQAASFSSIPAGWMGAGSFTRQEFIGILKTYRAHYRVAVARTPQQRQNVDWQSVVDDINEGYTEMSGGQDLKLQDSSDELWFSGIRYYGKNPGWTRVDLRTLGPADTTNAYENWLNSDLNSRTPFEIETPDKRITGETAADAGSYFYQSGPAPFPQSRGIYHYSNRTYNRNWGTLTGYATGNEKILLTMETMRLLKAEALLHLNPTANKQQVVSLLNESRVGNGDLQPAALTDPVGSMSDAQDPIKGADGDGATLWSMLKHEKRMESFATLCGIAFYDDRGWGDLVEGTPEDLPIPGSELLILEEAIYTSDVVGGTQKINSQPE